MPDDDVKAPEAGQDADQPVESAEVPQGDGQPDDRIAALESKIAQLGDFEKEIQGLRTANGRLQAQLRIANENAPGFTEAFNNYEEARTALLERGYSDDEIETLARTAPKTLKRLLTESAAPQPQTNGLDVTAQIKQLQEELAGLKGNSKKSVADENLGRPGGTPPRRNNAPPTDPNAFWAEWQKMKTGV